MNTETPTLLPEVAELKKRRERTSSLINPEILQSLDFLNSPEVIELQEIKEKIGLLGGKLNPVEMVTIDNVAAQKTRFLEVFGTDDESGVVFSYEKTKDNATAALKEGLIALVHKAKADEQMSFKAEDVEEMSLEDVLAEAISQVNLLINQLQTNRLTIRSNKADLEDPHARDLLRSKLAANIALKGLAIDIEATLQLVRGLSQNDDTQMAEAFGQIYGRTISPQLRTAANEYLEEVPKKAENVFIGGTSKLTEEEFYALVYAELNKLPSTPEGVAELNEMKESGDPRAELFANSQEIMEAFEAITNQLYEEYKKNKGVDFPEDQKFSFDIGDYSSIDVRDKSASGKVICIPNNRLVDLKTLYELMVHEIEAHVQQSYLSDLVVGLGGGMTKPNQEIIYEGLALTREDEGSREFLGIESKLSENKGFYILAMDLALHGKSFWDVAHFIYDQALDLLAKRGVPKEAIQKQAKEIAWLIPYRVFRGHHKLDGFNEKTGYAFTKDAAYLQGSLLVSQMNEIGMGNMAGVAISHLGALSLLARFDFAEENMPITYQRHSDKYFSEFLHPRLTKYVERTKTS